MPGITMEMLYNKLVDIEHIMQKILEREIENNIEEISFSKASKLLHKGKVKLLQDIEDGYLKAITYRDDEGNTRYRFRVCDIYEYQKLKKGPVKLSQVEVETFEDLARRIFGVPKRKSKINYK